MTVSYLPTSGFGTSSPGRGREARTWMGWTPFGTFCSGSLGKEGLVQHMVGGTPAFIVSLLISAWERRSCQATNWRAGLATAFWTVEGYRTVNGVMVC